MNHDKDKCSRRKLHVLTENVTPGLIVFLATPTSCLMGATATPFGHEMYT